MATQIAYLDCPSGISGDMLLGALLGAGAPEDRLRAMLATIPLGPYKFKTSQVLRAGLAGNRVEITTPEPQPHRHLSHIEKLLTESGLSHGAREKALAVFRRLAEAEGKLHAQPIEKVHFHEVGAVDAAHGTLPVPAPATVELLRGIPVYSSGIEGELVTPTGAALVSTLAVHFGSLPPMSIESIGYGAGTQDFPGHPNLARLMVGEKTEKPDAASDTVAVIQASVDDMSPQIYAYFMEQALASGALDVSCSPAQMKKNRPGLELTVLCAPEHVERLAGIIFEQTTTLGLRIQEARRIILERETVSVETPYGAVCVKVARRKGRVMNAAPEYEDCQRIARESSVPLKEVMLAAQVAFRVQNKSSH